MAWNCLVVSAQPTPPGEDLSLRAESRGFRSSRHSETELGQVFARIRREFPEQFEADFRVIVEGAPRSLRPVLCDEFYLIGYEALSNALSHSRASDIEVEVQYAPEYLMVLVRDNGLGIDPNILFSKRAGHYGLSAMKERTERIGGRLRVFSRVGAGTEVQLTVPGKIAYELLPHDPSSGRFMRFAWWNKGNEKSQSLGELAQ